VTRLVAGAAGGRRLQVPPGRATRPTAERVREALFSSLGPLDGLRVLDLYAGTGAVGLEALSRGAAEALLVEQDARAARVLRANVAALALPGARVLAMPVERLLAGTPSGAPYDVVFLDPPYALRIGSVLERVVPWAADLVVVERATRDGEPPWPAQIVAESSRRYGDSTLWYGRRS